MKLVNLNCFIKILLKNVFKRRDGFKVTINSNNNVKKNNILKREKCDKL